MRVTKLVGAVEVAVDTRILKLLLVLLISNIANAQMSSSQIFEQLKLQKGKWNFVKDAQQGACFMGDDSRIAIEFKLIGDETTIQENLMPDSDFAMVTMYHLEDMNDKDIIATHYCKKQNQPAFRADLKNSTPNRLIFKCDATRSKLCTSKEPRKGSYVDSIVHQMGSDGVLTIHYLGRGSKIDAKGYTRCKFMR